MVGTFKPKGNSSEWEWKSSSSRNKGKNAVEETKERNNNNSLVVSTIYITNFPPHIDSQDLWNMCGQVGTVADVYLPRKLSKSGKRFAFARFLLRVQDVDDASDQLARKLSAIWIGNHHIFATLARFDRKHEPKPFYQSQTRENKGDSNNDRPKLTHANDIKGMRTHANDVKGMRDGVIKVERKEDRISTLPDCLLLEILSRLPSTKYAIRTGALSKRWKHLWTSVHTLIFHHFDGGQEWSDFVSLVDKTLTQRPRLNLKKFDVQSCFYTGLESQAVNKWIHYAIRCNVEELDLALWHMLSLYKFVVDQFFFNNSCFTNLTLEGCILDPIGKISWKNLRSLYLFRLKLDDDMFQNILSGSPQLETLKLSDCYGYRRIDISSKSVKNLVLAGCLPGWCNYDEVGDITEINAPNIISVTIYGNLWLLTLLLVNVASLVQADLDYTSFGHWFTPPKEIEEKILKGFILKLCHAKELKIGSLCYEVVSRLRAKGFIFPSNVKFKSKPENRYLSLWGR